MFRILFVEYNLELIQDIAEILMAEIPGLHTEFAVDIPEALQLMESQEFDMAILDIMLPAYRNVPPSDEGIYLAAWIQGRLKGHGQQGWRQRPQWLVDRPPTLVFYSSSRATVVTQTWFELTHTKLHTKPKLHYHTPTFISRFRGDTSDHAVEIHKILSRVSTKAA